VVAVRGQEQEVIVFPIRAVALLIAGLALWYAWSLRRRWRRLSAPRLTESLPTWTHDWPLVAMSRDPRVLIDPALGDGRAARTAFEAIADSLFNACRGNVAMTEADEVRWRAVFLGAVLRGVGSATNPSAETDAVLALLVEEGALVTDDGSTYRLGRLPVEGGQT
jgi:hypothetical protein